MAKSKTPNNRLASFISNNRELLGWIAAGSLVVIFHNFSLRLSVWLASGEAGKWLSQAALSLQDFLTLTLSVIVEAVPFLILGTIISALIRRFLPPEKLVKILPKNTLFRRLVLSIAGLALPVCECGNVPVARSLLARGLKPADVVSFLFAAPILNPITIIGLYKCIFLKKLYLKS